jgi:ubiquilin
MPIKITFKVNGSLGKSFDLDLEPCTTCSEAKKKAEAECGVEAAVMRLMYKGRILKDTDTLEANKVENGHTFHLVKAVPTAAQASIAAPPAIPVAQPGMGGYIGAGQPAALDAAAAAPSAPQPPADPPATGMPAAAAAPGTTPVSPGALGMPPPVADSDTTLADLQREVRNLERVKKAKQREHLISSLQLLRTHLDAPDGEILAARIQPAVERYAAQIGQLVDEGFTDMHSNFQALVDANGDVTEAIRILSANRHH